MTETPENLPGAAPEATRWLESPLGQALLALETRLVEEAFDGLFGEQCVQLGLWGEPTAFTRFARTQRCATVGETPPAPGDDKPAFVGRLHRLPIASGSIDVVFLPHTLDFSNERAQAILREADRILMPHGHIVVLAFKPGGLWGLRRLVPGAGLPPGTRQLISDRKLADWLQLLDMRIEGRLHYFFRWPLTSVRRPTSPAWEARGQRFWPELGACYMLTAQKRVMALTPLTQPWSVRPKVVGGIAEPTARVARIRFERHR